MAASTPFFPKTFQERKAWIIENVLSLGTALLIVFAIRSSVIEAFKIPSGSMIPTLYIGDHIFVNKFAYGIKIPFSDLITDSPIYLYKRDLPKRGDIVVFLYPKDESIYFIKRVIGVPGDVVEMRNKVIYINQKPMGQDPFSEEKKNGVLTNLDDPHYPLNRMVLNTEHLEGVDHTVMIDQGNFGSLNYGPKTVPEDSLFVMGDNRDWSGDSRFWGFVPMRNVKGRAVVIWFSFWSGLSEHPFSFRPNRIGTLLN